MKFISFVFIWIHYVGDDGSNEKVDLSWLINSFKDDKNGIYEGGCDATPGTERGLRGALRRGRPRIGRVPERLGTRLLGGHIYAIQALALGPVLATPEGKPTLDRRAESKQTQTGNK